MLASSRFREGLDKIPGATVEKAGEMLDELATGWSRFSVDLIPNLGRAIFSRGFDPNIDYDSAQIESHAARPRRPIRRSCCSRTAPTSTVRSCRWPCRRTDLPPVHTFAGINLSFGFMGPLMRRSGVIFIRRKLDDPLYKYVLRQFVGYLVAKRFNLSWSIEGTRSRTGKMLPPKLGLLTYVADAYLDGRSDDILLQPVSISFDQLHETREYAAYARGGEKTPEGLSWLYNFIKAQGERNFGKIYVRFPPAVSMRQYLGVPHGEIGRRRRPPNALRCRRWPSRWPGGSWATPRSTPAGLVSALLLTTRGIALTLNQVHHTLQDSLDYLERKATPVTDSAAAAAHPRRCAVGAGCAVRRASRHPHRRRPGNGMAHRPRGRARGRVLPQHDHPRVFGNVDRRTRAGLRRPRRQ